MKTDRWDRIRELFDEACELGPADRRDFLADACGDDDHLRMEVESILAAGEQTPELLDEPAVNAFPELFDPHRSEALVGRRVGAYELVKLLACGGMGAVYLARRADDEYDQTVAIKLIKHRIVSDDTLRRFRAERQTLALLDHPNIARLLDAGVTPDGVPFFVMEYVDGVSIDRYCDEHMLSTLDRLRLFRRVCSAVSFAHQKLIVHRDLKPSNILVTPDGVPKLLDFGIAKVLETNTNGQCDDPTETLQRVMTPEYASPEQIRAEPVTTAADVYSLGVVLFELLTGHRPFRLRNRLPHEIARTICEQDPPRPSTAIRRVEEVTFGDPTTRIPLTPESVSRTREGEPERLRRRLSGDVDEIILKALRKEPTRRYESVEQFSQDIRRHLEGLPVAARRGSFRYRGAKFLRRNRTRVIVAAVMALSLMAGLVATTWQGRLAREANSQTQAEARRLERANAFLTRMLASVDPGAATGPHGAIRLMLDEAVRSIEAGALADQPAVEASVRTTIGMTYLRLGGLSEAGEHLATALEIRRRVLGDLHALVAEGLNNMGLLARASGDLDAAETYYRDALRQRRVLLGPESAEYAETLNNLGVLLKTTGRLERAEEFLRDALELRRAVLRRREREEAVGSPVTLAARADVATTTVNLAAVLKNKGAFDEALALYHDAVVHLRATLGPEHYRVAVCLNNLALLLTDTGRYEEAQELYHESLAIRRTVFGDEHLAVATGLKNLALLLTTLGRYEEAEPLYREALDLGRRLPGSTLALATTMNNLADLLASMQRCDEAQPLARAALAIRRGRDPDHPRLASSLLVLGRALAGCGDPAAAQPLLRESLSRYGRRQPVNDLKIARAQSELGGCLIDLDSFEEAEELLLASFSRVRDAGVRHPVLARETLARIIDLYESWGRPDAAAPYMDMEDHL